MNCPHCGKYIDDQKYGERRAEQEKVEKIFSLAAQGKKEEIRKVVSNK